MKLNIYEFYFMETIIRYNELHLKSDPVKRQMLSELRKNIRRITEKNVKIVDGRVVVDDYNKQRPVWTLQCFWAIIRLEL